jgi:hypothetical protein
VALQPEEKVLTRVLSVAMACKRPVVVVADACFASGKVITPLSKNGQHLVSHAKSNAVAYLPVPKVLNPGKG